MILPIYYYECNFIVVAKTASKEKCMLLPCLYMQVFAVTHMALH